MDKNKLSKACAKEMKRQDMFGNHLGIKIIDIDIGYSKMSMVVQEFMLNGHKSCQGGAIFSFADDAFAYACNGQNILTVAFSCDITFIKPAYKDDTLIAVAKERVLVGRNGIYDITITNQNEEIVAVFSGKSRAVKGLVLSKEQLKDI